MSKLLDELDEIMGEKSPLTKQETLAIIRAIGKGAEAVTESEFTNIMEWAINLRVNLLLLDMLLEGVLAVTWDDALEKPVFIKLASSTH